MPAFALVLAGCAGPVKVDEPDPSAQVRRICAGLVADLPGQVLDASRRETNPGVLSAAWGDPPIVLRCGVPQPAAMTQASQCFEVNGVGWLAEEGKGGFLFTTIGRPALVELGVPDAYAPEANALVDVAAAIQAHDPVQQPCA
ncbi:hypothetical protein JOE57_003489 [Microlunatus panaciterrae]|uniref:DUF3515 domain-containing protein n=1 Tax=Microlunatus panaciterrae TaxID=400768 RepID=A0ABS2RPH5_9ACTN|nr:DUF3515 domain-containing protein [Microlunatus panaciterrae]MBM7800568.1 hypothetical protein [Microlunatus panaciterrae]